ncbi:MAG: hypothetical protein AB8G96_12795 [Phycisphaerales bacterium]
MADELRPSSEGEPNLPIVGEEGDELRAPRRAASAEFVVESEAGSAAVMREAMDPANQSLREALRLSYRVLQVVIAALIIVFAFSGFTQVEALQSGVMLRFGRIVGEENKQALEPGPAFSIFPYPAGEFVLFRASNREIDLGRPYWPDIQGDVAEAIENATPRVMPPGPNRDGRGDGYVLTAEGEIAHIKIRTTYDIENPVQFVNAVTNEMVTDSALHADRVVGLLAMRGTVHTAAQRSLTEFVEFTDEERQSVRSIAQLSLDRLATGITLGPITTPVEPTPALAAVRAENSLQTGRSLNEAAIKGAITQAENRLIDLVDSARGPLIALIDEFEAADLAGDVDRRTELLARIDEVLESDDARGEVSTIIQRAKASESVIDSTLGRQHRRFMRLLEPYRRNPRSVIDREWARVYTAVLRPTDTEIVKLPGTTNLATFHMTSNRDIADIRRRQQLDRARRENAQRIMGMNIPAMRGASDFDNQLENRAGRVLERDGNAFDN